MKFADLRLAEPILRAVSAAGYTIATPIQAQAIPLALAGRDVLGCAQTGTGKTAAFALPILQLLAASAPAAAAPAPVAHGHAGSERGAKSRHVQNGAQNRLRSRCLILAPTRELAVQISDDFRAYGKFLPLRTTVIFGGVGQNPQVDALRRGVEIVIATPGRLLDLMEQGHVDLRGIEMLVLDEADRMLDMGFITDIRKIVARMPQQRQTMFFSATMPNEIRKLADSLLNNPASVQLAPVSSTADKIDQCVYFVERGNKPSLLAHLVNTLPMTRAIVFTRTKHGADRVVRHLHSRNIRAEAIHGNKSQNARQRALDNFKSNKIPVLVATDIASRGIDVDGITHVVNYDITHEPETYVHRIGRTARAGASGSAVSLCDRDERSNLRAIEKLIRQAIAVKPEPADYPKTSTKPEPEPQRGGHHRTPDSRRSHSQQSHSQPSHSRGTNAHAPSHSQHSQGQGQRPRHAPAAAATHGPARSSHAHQSTGPRPRHPLNGGAKRQGGGGKPRRFAGSR